jgi:hypothetical protein
MSEAAAAIATGLAALTAETRAELVAEIADLAASHAICLREAAFRAAPLMAHHAAELRRLTIAAIQAFNGDAFAAAAAAGPWPPWDEAAQARIEADRERLAALHSLADAAACDAAHAAAAAREPSPLLTGLYLSRLKGCVTEAVGVFRRLGETG